MVSAAITEPACPHTAPTTPMSRLVGVVPGTAGAACRSRSVTGRAGGGGADQNTETWKARPTSVPHTCGTPSAAAVSAIRYLAA